jgi:type I restriction enzyme S subunit
MNIAKLEEVAQIGMGQSPPSTSYNEGGRGLFFLQGCSEFGAKYPTPVIYCDSPTRIAPKDSLLISVRAPVGTLNLADRDYCIGRGLGYIKGNSVPTRYLYYLLSLKKHELEKRGQGSTFEAINSADLKNLNVELPSAPEQTKIVQILSSIDHVIEKTHSLIAKYNAIKQGMIQDLFTRGVDINGELRPSYKEAPDLYKSSEWGWIPKEWKVVKTESMCSDIIDCPHSTPNYIQDGIPCIRTADMIPCCLMLDQAFRISLDDYHVRIIRLEPKKGDIIYSREGERLGIASIVGDSKVCLGQRVMLLRPSTYTDCNFLVWAMNHCAFYQQAFIRIGATTSPHINVADIKQFKIVRPELEEQIRIGSRLNAVLSCIQAEENTVKKLLNIKSGLMQDLLTGKVRVNVDGLTESSKDVGVHQS